ncbi:MAG: membrane protease subunit, stomatin/prohibitin [Planctomycetes bacterium]|nr:membrane protease subunit, stomatin/prohibitin [Planctomycetota bacterium]
MHPVDLTWLRDLFEEHRRDLMMAFFALFGAVVRAMGITVKSGQRALRFTGGRAGAVLDPGFHWLIPFLQVARPVPTRSRTIDLPAQRVTTLAGFVFTVDANLVYRVADLRKALVEIDDLQKGMGQMLGLGVQEVLRTASQQEARGGATLDRLLTENLARRLEAWGVTVEQAGFTTITPTRETIRLTQLGHATVERGRALTQLTRGGESLRAALTLVGTRTQVRSRTRHLRGLEQRNRRRRRHRRLLHARGLAPGQSRELLRGLESGRLQAQHLQEDRYKERASALRRRVTGRKGEAPPGSQGH